MTPNVFLEPYSGSEITNMVSSGSITPRYDDNWNLLLDNGQTSITGSGITIQLNKSIFYSQRVETMFDTAFTELN